MLRLLRLARLSRLARMLRSMPELLILCKGMASAMHTVIFVLILLFILMYVFAIAFCSLLRGKPAGDKYFPNMQQAIYYLVVGGTFLDDLRNIADQIGADDSIAAVLFFVFVVLSALMVMNLLIGVLCEVVSAVAETEKEDMLMAFFKDTLQEVFSDLDDSGDGMISKQEFGQIVVNKKAALALDEVGIDPAMLVDFIDQIFEEGADPDAGPDEEDGENGLCFGKFVDVLLQYRGCRTATVKDIIDHRKWFTSWVKKEMNKQTRLFQHLLSSELHSRGIGEDVPPSPPPKSCTSWESLSRTNSQAGEANGATSSRQTTASNSPCNDETVLLNRFQRLSMPQRKKLARLVEELENTEEDFSSKHVPGCLD